LFFGAADLLLKPLPLLFLACEQLLEASELRLELGEFQLEVALVSLGGLERLERSLVLFQQPGPLRVYFGHDLLQCLLVYPRLEHRLLHAFLQVLVGLLLGLRAVGGLGQCVF
jgi:hypothetical protein